MLAAIAAASVVRGPGVAGLQCQTFVPGAGVPAAAENSTLSQSGPPSRRKFSATAASAAAWPTKKCPSPRAWNQMLKRQTMTMTRKLRRISQRHLRESLDEMFSTASSQSTPIIAAQHRLRSLPQATTSDRLMPDRVEDFISAHQRRFNPEGFQAARKSGANGS